MSNTDPEVQKFKGQLAKVMALISSGIVTLPQAAHAYVAGNLSYTRFIEAV